MGWGSRRMSGRGDDEDPLSRGEGLGVVLRIEVEKSLENRKRFLDFRVTGFHRRRVRSLVFWVSRRSLPDLSRCVLHGCVYKGSGTEIPGRQESLRQIGRDP